MVLLNDLSITGDVLVIPNWFLILLITWLVFRNSILQVISEIRSPKNKRRSKDESNEKVVYDNEFFSADPKDWNVLISKKDEAFRIRFRRENKDRYELSFSKPHKFEQEDESFLMNNFLGLKKIIILRDDRSSFFIDKSSAAAWDHFGEEMAKQLFRIFHEKYPVA